MAELRGGLRSEMYKGFADLRREARAQFIGLISVAVALVAAVRVH
jgi:hypothetical protein